MTKDQAIDKIRKLKQVAASYRALGQTEAANAYRDKARQLMGIYGITRAMLNAKNREPMITGVWVCTCGFQIEMTIDAGALNDEFAEMMLGPHRLPGHNLRQV